MILQPIKFADKFLCKSARLKNWNYSTPGIYFITICTLNGNNFFGKITNNKIELSKMGLIANQCLINIPAHFANVCLNAFVVMPNHVHILFHVETPDLASLQDNQKITLITLGHRNHPDYYSRLNQKSKQIIPKIIQQFKSSVKRQSNQQKLFFSWQSRFHDHLIDNQKELSIIQNYIINNPANWLKDKYYAN